ncbi:hypothetical protein V6N13_034246 [Hibiscus sabdariffa]
MVLGSHKEQYSMIYDYLGDIRKTNPGSTTILMLDDKVFLRMYICLQACKDGYKAGCRPVLSIDGCHLKGYYGGTFLAAVAVDANDNIYLIAYAVVEAENQSSWSWFLSLLGIDLEIGKAIFEVFTCAEHRTCVRHLYSNFKNKEHLKGKNLKDALWKATRATYVKEFEDVMVELKALSVPAFDWLKGNGSAQWSKSHFSPRSKCDMLLSNLSECFNMMILEARDKPILTLMEMVRTTMMQKIVMKKEEVEKWTEISCVGPHMLEATRIPCIHAVLVMILRNERPESYVHACYKTTTQQQIYNHFIEPVRGPNQWLHDTTCESVIEPNLRRPPGRPKKQRVKEADEAKNSGAKWTKKGMVMYCSKCKKPGHNQRTCKGEIGANRRVRQPRVASARPPLRTPKLQVRRATDNMTTTSLSQIFCATTSPSPFVFIPTPGHVITVRWMPSSQVENNGTQHLSQSSTVIQTSQEDNNPCTMAKKPRMV